MSHLIAEAVTPDHRDRITIVHGYRHDEAGSQFVAVEFADGTAGEVDVLDIFLSAPDAVAVAA
ncbi:hypothetical protein [Rhodococcus sp. IEGM 1307]|uniref:hypothetical protein n=1 Tax=Rhodococcus sp. IEGM 1307 TaxID=3047091 RepID=UPI0024B77B1F|nr:hypothetical protein [Rhodococcus sp. IEGM 1307]MDI9979473.1 hypothetical protein [Rhodococcus sp. IEGM 1307]